MIRFSLLALLLAMPGASAHTAVTSVTPAANTTVAAPGAVRISFSEPVNLRFSTFKVYPLKATGTTLTQAAKRLAPVALAARDDASVRADTAPILTGRAARVTLPLKPNLPAGPYLIVWRVLSEDGHPVTGHHHFHVK
ncbi:copper resistance protein CopC [Deinococcus deserti]|uniref:Putative copper resistance protein CopC n=1 Tax=Deinococcus deserti (strain DSM 17065 / CIP 109153 / LMG 22923 / VCD115) TaxID=546414 RepID=C1D3J3_DEIDV|nr:copper resistance protein CopC [Deinococcus deserti]ACO48072.1 putative copper resistance protein CopC, precursor [Deinococcus deserti VCD115]